MLYQLSYSRRAPTVEGGGFEPPQAQGRQIYSLLPLATRESLQNRNHFEPPVTLRVPLHFYPLNASWRWES